jgi:hypothetical protein
MVATDALLDVSFYRFLARPCFSAKKLSGLGLIYDANYANVVAVVLLSVGHLGEAHMSFNMNVDYRGTCNIQLDGFGERPVEDTYVEPRTSRHAVTALPLGFSCNFETRRRGITASVTAVAHMRPPCAKVKYDRTAGLRQYP